MTKNNRKDLLQRSAVRLMELCDLESPMCILLNELSLLTDLAIGLVQAAEGKEIQKKRARRTPPIPPDEKIVK